MKNFRWAIFAGFSALAIYGMTQTARKPEDLASAVSGYKKWTAANKVPYLVNQYYYMLCRGMNAEEQAWVSKVDPFHGGYIKVWVNGIGKDAMFSGKPFPVGTVIVKDKHKKETDPVSLSTVMRKREKGYNPACGDWEFGVLDKDAKVTEQGKIADCMDCHKGLPKQDFTFRRYVDKK